MKYMLILCLTALLHIAPANVQAAECTDQVRAKVNGLICDFCARSMEKVFGKREEVKAIAVNLDAGRVDITLQPGKTLDDATISTLITDSGYDVTGIERGC